MPSKKKLLGVKGAQVPGDDARSQTSLTVVVTPHETIEPQRLSPKAQIAKAAAKHTLRASQKVTSAKKTATTAVKATVAATGRAMSATAQSAAAATEGAGKAAKATGKLIGQSAAGVAKAGASAVANTAAGAAHTSKRAAGRTARAANAATHFVGDLNGDGRVDAEDLMIAKAAINKAAAELSGEAWELSKAALRHDLTREAAARALVGGAVAAVVPVIGVPVGAAVGAATVLLNGSVSSAAAAAIGKGAKAVTEARQAGRPKSKKPAPRKSKA